MKGIIIVDIPVSEPVEIDEYCMMADLQVWPAILCNRKDLFFELKNVDIRPLPEPRILPKNETDGTEYGLDPWFSDGWNECLEKIKRNAK